MWKSNSSLVVESPVGPGLALQGDVFQKKPNSQKTHLRIERHRKQNLRFPFFPEILSKKQVCDKKKVSKRKTEMRDTLTD